MRTCRCSGAIESAFLTTESIYGNCPEGEKVFSRGDPQPSRHLGPNPLVTGLVVLTAPTSVGLAGELPMGRGWAAQVPVALNLLFLTSNQIARRPRSLQGRVYGRCRMECRTMEWNRSWRFWRREAYLDGAKGQSSARRSEPQSTDEWEDRLLSMGVSENRANRLAEELKSAYLTLGPGSAPALLEGATLTFAAQADEQANVERNLREVKEVERLLGAFSGELEKLDEVLEVLAAYAQRMRAKPAKSSRRVLH